MNYIKKKLEATGIDVYDTPKVIGTYLLANKILYGSMFVLCYRHHVLYNLCKRYRVESFLMNKFPKAYARGKQYYIKKVDSVSKSKIYNKTTKFFGLNPKNTLNTILETSLLYKLSLPITFFPMLWLSAYPYRKQSMIISITQETNNNNNEKNENNENNEKNEKNES
jgi:hypothetical protein